MNEKKEKPKYGWYVKKLIITCIILGLFGISLFVLSFLFGNWVRFFFIIVGIVVVLFFLWPGFGMALMNIIITKNLKKQKEIEMPMVQESPKILDIGCGTGRTAIKIAKDLKNGGYLYGIDVYNKVAIGGNSLETVKQNARIEGVQDKTSFGYGSALDIPFEDETFNVVNLSSVLHELHIKNEISKALEEAYRVLKPGGWLIVGEWNKFSWQLICYCGVFCFVFKDHNFWREIIEQQGFGIKAQLNNGGFYLFSAQKPKN
ncbi:MAG: methyltransferase domain-containing protein [Candidatus Lokiarchaeota archaeon]|nr:methyltransferase domain-containing protein [Candidatus Lokiarchaeota archaeon]